MLGEGNRTGIVGRPENLNERVILATECVSRYKFSAPMVIDGMDGKVNRDYRAAPVRVTVVDIEGKVVFYAGPGPFDFRIPPIDRTLKKLVANKGHMPPAPAAQWGPEADGLRCGLSLDPPTVTVGDNVAVQLKFENTADEAVGVYYKPADAIARLVVSNDKGKVLKLETSGRQRRPGRRREQGSSSVQEIGPGEVFETEIECKVATVSDETALVAGQFRAVYRHEVTDAALAQIEPAREKPAWTGTITSGACTLNVTLPEQLGCIDCHGGSNYHHVHERDCTRCHVGQMGTADFDTKDEACVQCHRREGQYGRRQILGPGGEFDLVSRHLAGTIEDKDCLLCHDNSRHGEGLVRLIDPDSGGTEPWTGTRAGFCLTCHDGEPPAHVSFPNESTGSGFDKMKFLDSAVAQTEQGCSYCHNPHGSAYPALLKDLHAH